MQQTVDNSMTLSEGIIGALATGAVTWLIASVTKVSKGEFKELAARVAAIEKDRIPREEFERAMQRQEALVQRQESLVREFRAEMKEQFKELKSEIKT